MKILDRYMLKDLILSLIWCIIIFVFLYMIVDLFSNLDDIIKQRVGLKTLLFYYLALVPIIFVQISPIAVLISTMYTLGMLNKTNEITAMKANGINIWQILRPFIFTGLFLSVLIVFINDKAIPKAYIISNNIKQNEIETEKKVIKKSIINNLTLYGEQNRMFYAKSFDIQTNTLNELIILEHDANQILHSKIISKKAQWQNNKWIFYDCIIYTFDIHGQTIGDPEILKELNLNIPETPKDFKRYHSQTDFMTYKQLKEYIVKVTGCGKLTVKKLLVDLYSKRSFPFINFVIIIIGAPFALITKRGGVLAGLGISLFLGFIYYATIAISLALGKGGAVPPFLACWGPNILYTIIGIRLIKKYVN